MTLRALVTIYQRKGADYVTQQHFSPFAGAFLPPGNGGSGAACKVAETVIDRAEAQINGIASVQYAVPMEPTGLLEDWTICLAEFELYQRGPGSAVLEKISAARQRTNSQLDDLAAGKIGTGGNLIRKEKRIGDVPIVIRIGSEMSRMA